MLYTCSDCIIINKIMILNIGFSSSRSILLGLATCVGLGPVGWADEAHELMRKYHIHITYVL